VGDLQAKTEWNAILSINVLEHIERDQEELAAYHSLLRPARGALCLFVPARPEIYAPIDRDFGHFRRYNAIGATQETGNGWIRAVEPSYYNLAGYFAWWRVFAC